MFGLTFSLAELINITISAGIAGFISWYILVKQRKEFEEWAKRDLLVFLKLSHPDKYNTLKENLTLEYSKKNLKHLMSKLNKIK